MMTNTTSPLQAINKKELELRRRVEEADRQAEAQIQAAREQARKVIAQANREGQAKAEALFQQGIEEARQQAKVIVAAAHEEAATLHLKAKPRLDEVAKRIVMFVLTNEKTVEF
jgi:vacuolar-type H+-ATPase subunit H